MLYWIARGIFRFFLFFVFRIRVVGKEHVPSSGGAIMAINHRSNWDVLVAGTISPRKLRFMAKAEMFKNKLFATVLHAVGAFPVQRGKGDIGAIKGSLAKLKSGHVIAMFPEGRRVKQGEVSSPKPGVVMLAIHSQVPVIPTYISGRYRWFGKITIHFGEPIYYDQYYDQKVVMEELQTLSNGLMQSMRGLEKTTQK